MIEERFVKAGGRRLAVRLIAWERRPPCLVFLHEGLGSIAQWQDFPQELAEAAALPALVYERYGHGRSDPLGEPRQPAYLHEEALIALPEVLRACAAGDPLLVGHSDGGSIALIYASRAGADRPARAVVTMAAHVFVEPESLAGIRRTVAAYETGGLRRRLEHYHGDRTDRLFRGWADIWLSEAFRDFRIELSGVECPVLALQGEDDEYGTPEQLRRIAAGVRGPVETELIPRCGHAPYRQARETVLRRVVEFIRSPAGR